MDTWFKAINRRGEDIVSTCPSFQGSRRVVYSAKVSYVFR